MSVLADEKVSVRQLKPVTSSMTGIDSAADSRERPRES